MTNNGTTQKVYSKLKEQICELELKPEEPLVESTIAQKLNVSRTPVREAFRLLNKEKLINLIPGKGAFVSSVTTQDIEEIFILREALEGMAARLAANKIPKSALKSLEHKFNEEANEKWENEKGDTVEELHDIIIKYAGNSLIKEDIDNLNGPIERFQKYALILPERDRTSFNEHKKIFNSLKQRNPDLSEKNMRYHIKSTKLSLLESWIG